MSDHSTDSNSRVPSGDIDYAVDNALWVAEYVTVSSSEPDFLGIFGRQIEHHWRSLLALHAPDCGVPDAAEQSGLARWSA